MSPARRGAVRLPAVARAIGLWLAGGLASTGLALIWIARITANRFVYVSELGATGEPTAEVFRWGMVLVAVSAAIVALCAPRLNPRLRWLAVLPPAAVLAGAAIAFGIASQVTCTVGCPLPVGSQFTWQDLIHTSCAVLGFAGAAFVMLQVAADRRYRRLARFSLSAAIAVAVIAGVGGLLSLLRFGTEIGGVLELVATTVALSWLVGLAVFLAVAAGREVGAARVVSGPDASVAVGAVSEPDASGASLAAGASAVSGAVSGPDASTAAGAQAQSQPSQAATPARVAATWAE